MKIKNLLLTFVAITTILSFNISTVFAFYSDVPVTSPYYQSVKTLYDNGRLPELKDNLFNPDSPLKITDLYTFLLSYKKVELSNSVLLPYSDTDNSAFYAKYIQTAIDLGLLKPVGEKAKLNPNTPLSKLNTIRTMFDTLGIGVDKFFDKTTFPFTDIKNNSSEAAIAEKAYEIGILENNSSLFKKAKRISRGEAINYLFKIYSYVPSKEPQVKIIYTNVNDPYKNTGITDSKSFGTFVDVWDKINNDYLYKDNVDKQTLIFDAIEGMVQGLGDKYTVFEKPSNASTFINSLSSEYEGIGTAIDMVDNKIRITSVFAGSPAQKAGIIAGDIITKIDDQDVEGMTIDAVANKIKGKAGTTVKLTIQRANESHTYTLTREKVTNKSVTFSVLPKGTKKVGYIRITSFSTDTSSEFLTAAKNLLNQKVDGFIIDLRDNPGGYMDTAISIVSMFTNKKQIAVKLSFSNGTSEQYDTNGDGTLNGKKIVVLINNNSASAAEILAGALQDMRIAKIIGEQSYGKGSVQQVIQYNDGSLFKYTISKWLTPSGRDINKKGITPDKVVKNSNTKDNQLDTALAEF